MQQNIEIERKFLVTNDSYKQLSTSHYTIQQGYISKDPDRTVRVRIKTLADGTAEAYITIKSKPNEVGFSRFEWEKKIDVADAKQIIELCLPGVIEKTRWIVPATVDGMPDAVWEIDEFHGRLAGRVLAELELQREQQTFIRPDFVGQEVTGLPQYYNANM